MEKVNIHQQRGISYLEKESLNRKIGKSAKRNFSEWMGKDLTQKKEVSRGSNSGGAWEDTLKAKKG